MWSLYAFSYLLVQVQHLMHVKTVLMEIKLRTWRQCSKEQATTSALVHTAEKHVNDIRLCTFNITVINLGLIRENCTWKRSHRNTQEVSEEPDEVNHWQFQRTGHMPRMTVTKHLGKPISWFSTLPNLQKTIRLPFPLNGTDISTLTALVAMKRSFKHTCFVVLILIGKTISLMLF